MKLKLKLEFGIRNLDWPIYYKDSLIVGNPDSDTAVVTLWSPKEVVAASVDLSSTSVVGQLYTKRGINFILRNVLANPRLRKLYVLGSDLSGSGEALLNYDFDIDKEIDLKAFSAFKQNVTLVDNRKLTAKLKIKGKNSAPWREPEIFADSAPNFPETFPSEFSNIIVRASKISDAWVNVLASLLKFGVRSKPVQFYDEKGATFLKELLNIVVEISDEDPHSFEVTKYLPFNRRDAERYITNFFSKDKGDDDYTYGERLFDYDGFDQITHTVKKLKAFPQDKGALSVLWKPKEDS